MVACAGIAHATPIRNCAGYRDERDDELYVYLSQSNLNKEFSLHANTRHWRGIRGARCGEKIARIDIITNANEGERERETSVSYNTGTYYNTVLSRRPRICIYAYVCCSLQHTRRTINETVMTGVMGTRRGSSIKPFYL